VTAVAFKPSEESSLGIHTQEKMVASKLPSLPLRVSLFIGTSLNVSMALENIKEYKRTAYLEAAGHCSRQRKVTVAAEPQDSTTVIRS